MVSVVLWTQLRIRVFCKDPICTFRIPSWLWLFFPYFLWQLVSKQKSSVIIIHFVVTFFLFYSCYIYLQPVQIWWFFINFLYRLDTFASHQNEKRQRTESKQNEKFRESPFRTYRHSAGHRALYLIYLQCHFHCDTSHFASNFWHVL